MEKLNFVMTDGDEIIFDETLDYDRLGSEISFKIDDFKIVFKFNNTSFIFKKFNDSQEFVITYDKNAAYSHILLVKESIKFPLDIDVVEYFYDDNYVTFRYKISSDPKNVKTITFRYWHSSDYM